MSSLSTQWGIVDEVTYGTPILPTRFYEVEGVPSVKGVYERTESVARRAGDFVQREDKAVTYSTGAVGDITMPFPTKSGGLLLKHMFGTIATGATVDSNTPHTATVGTLVGKSFTQQTGKVHQPAGTVIPFTYAGSKIASWELSCDLDGLLMLTLTTDSQRELVTGDAGALALATAVYPTAATVFAFTGAVVTVAATTVELKNFSLSGDNMQNTGRRFLGANASLKKEPNTNDYRTFEFAAEAEFVDLTHLNRYRSATNAGAYGAIVATFTGPVIHAGATFPTLVLTIPSARFDTVDLDDGGEEGMMQSISGVARTPTAGGSPATAVYTTTDATP